MAHKEINEPFLMVPYKLLRIREYGRFFDGAAVGFIYRRLRTGVNRRGLAKLKASGGFFNENGWVTQLSKEYDAGNLCAYITIDDLAEETAYCTKSIRNHLDTLERLRLIKIKAFGNGLIITMGKRLISRDEEGYSVGKEHEGFFIDEWETMADQDIIGFRRFIVEELASPKQKVLALGKIIPEEGKNFSTETTSEMPTLFSLGGDKPEVEPEPRIDKVRIDSLKDCPQEAERPVQDDFSEHIERIVGADSWDERLRASREAVSCGMLVKDVNRVLGQYVPQKIARQRFMLIPRTAVYLAVVRQEKGSDAARLAKLWAYLHEDVTGVVATSTKAFYREVQGAYKNNLLTHFPFEQCVWSFGQALAKTNDLEFLAKGGRNLIRIVESYSKEYNDMMSERKVMEHLSLSAVTKRAEERRKRDMAALAESSRGIVLDDMGKYIMEQLKRGRDE